MAVRIGSARIAVGHRFRGFVYHSRVSLWPPAATSGRRSGSDTRVIHEGLGASFPGDWLRLHEGVSTSDVSAPTGTLVSMAVESVATVEAIVARLVEALPETRYPSADATWEAGVDFARRWAELSGPENALALTPRGPGAV